MSGTTGRGREGRYLLLLVAIVLVEYLVLSILAPESYPTLRNAQSMALQLAPIGMLALAVGTALLVGGIDLSIVATANLASISAAMAMTAAAGSASPGVAILAGVGAGLAVGAACGAFNGFLVSRLGASPIVITLGTLTLYTGIATGITGGSTQFAVPAYQRLGIETVLAMPLPFVVLLLLTGALALLTGTRRWGFRAYVVGASETVARYSRLDVRRIQVTTYTIAGMLSSMAGLSTLATTNAASVSFGTSFLLLAILVAVLAGMDPYGGSGRLLGVPLAMIAMQQLSTGINMVLAGSQGANFAKEFAWGVLLIAVLALGRSNSVARVRELLVSLRDGAQDPPTGPAADQAEGESRPAETDRPPTPRS